MVNNNEVRSAASRVDTTQTVTDSSDYLTSPQMMVASGNSPDTSIADLASQYINQYDVNTALDSCNNEGRDDGRHGNHAAGDLSELTTTDHKVQDMN